MRSGVDACTIHQPSTDGEPPSGGSVPAALVGTWYFESATAVIERTFEADGTYHELSSLTQSGACTMKYVWDEAGTVTFTATEMTLERKSGTLKTETCSTNEEKPVGPETETRSYELEGGILYVWGPDCADVATCAQAFEKR